MTCAIHSIEWRFQQFNGLKKNEIEEEQEKKEKWIWRAITHKWYSTQTVNEHDVFDVSLYNMGLLIRWEWFIGLNKSHAIKSNFNAKTTQNF